MQRNWKSSGSSLAFVLAVVVQGCGGSEIPAVDGEDAALKGGIPASDNGKGHRPDGVAGSSGSGRVDDKDAKPDAGVDDACAVRAKGVSSMHANDKGEEKSGMAGADAKGKSDACGGAKGAGMGVGKGSNKGSKADAAGDDMANDDDADNDEDQAQDENSGN
jgi:hypothetical protein